MRSLRSYITGIDTIVLVIVIAFILFIHFTLLLPATDAGIFMYGAQLITKGYYPYTHLWDDKPPLIYFIGTIGFFIKTNPFLGIRILEVAVFFLNLYLIKRICSLLHLQQPANYLLSFCSLYLIFWDQGFLTETFNIPLVLLAIYFFTKKIAHFEFVMSLFIVTGFLLKPNSIVIPGFIALIDIFSGYRKTNTFSKLIKYLLSIAIFSSACYWLIVNAGLWQNFIDQAFAFNLLYIKQQSFSQLLLRHFAQHTFLSIIGIIFFLLLNIFILSSLSKYWVLYRSKKGLLQPDKLIALSCISFYLALYPTYISGRSYPHYFMLLIVPVCFILGNYSNKYYLRSIAFLFLATIGCVINTRNIISYKETYHERQLVIDFTKTNTKDGDYIHVEGLNDACIYLLTNRLSNTKFINAIPFYEKKMSDEQYSKILSTDFSLKKPALIILNNADHKAADKQNFYFKTLDSVLQNYYTVYESSLYCIYKPKQ